MTSRSKASTGAPLGPRVIVVFGSRPGQDSKSLRRHIENRSSELGFTHDAPRKTHPTRVGPQGRPLVGVLAPTDACALYRSLHRAPVLIFELHPSFVQRRPNVKAQDESHLVRLEQFVAHKAYFASVKTNADADCHLDRFAVWHQTVSCEGQNDPRALPLHAFNVDHPWADLVSDDGRKTFNRKYGGTTQRTDPKNRLWRCADARHGREILRVAGCDMPRGAHWDVNSPRSRTELVAANAVWAVPRRGYVNVSPDGAIRGGSRGTPTAKRLWPR